MGVLRESSRPPAYGTRGGGGLALSSSASVALGEIAGEPGEQDLELRFVLGVQKRLESGYVPAPVGGLALRTPEGGERSDFRILGRFLHEKSFDTLVVYDAPTGGLQGGQARLVLDSADVKEPKVIDPVRDVELLTGPGAVPGASFTLTLVTPKHM